jgi:Ca-activated chloride channel family protein
MRMNRITPFPPSRRPALPLSSFACTTLCALLALGGIFPAAAAPAVPAIPAVAAVAAAMAPPQAASAPPAAPAAVEPPDEPEEAPPAASAPATPGAAAPAPGAAPAAGAKKPGSEKPRKLSRSEQKKRLAALPHTYKAWLDEVDVLITPEEKSAFLLLDKDYQRDAFMERFWQVRDKYHLGGRSAFHEQWDSRVEEARTHYGNIKEDRSRILLLNGPPSVEITSNCQILWPLEVWYYQSSDRVRYEFFVIFYQRWGVGTHQIWEPNGGLGDLFRDTANPDERSLNAVADGCINGDKVAGAIGWILQQRLGYGMIEAQFESRPEGPGTEWTKTFNTYSTDLPDTAVTFPAKLNLDYPGRYQARTVVQAVMQVAAADIGQAQLGDARSYNLLLTGEVIQGKKLFDSFRYKFDFPASEVQDGKLPLVFQRYLRPGTYTLVLKGEDVNSGKFYRSEQKIIVPETDQVAPTAPPLMDPESRRILDEANKALRTGETTVKIIRPQGELHTGMQRFDTLATGKDIQKVTFVLDGKPILTKKVAPYSVELDLGSVPRTRKLDAVAYNEKGEVLAQDQLLINSAGHRFAVHLVEPQRGYRYEKSLLAQADVEVPEDQAVEKVEFYLNETLVATAYQPPYTQPILLPKTNPSYVRAVAYTVDGSTTEDLVFVNAPEGMERLNIQYVELYASVLDKRGHPVDKLAQKNFTPYEDGVKQQITRFDQVTDLPLHTAITLDVSASMEASLPETQQAALQFIQQTVRPKDRATVITFNDHPNLAVKFTNNVTTLAGGLAGLKAERGTALYDSIIFTLYYFNGVKGQRAMLLLSDGKDESSRFTFEDAIEYARRAGVTIYTIGLGKEVDKKHLSKIAEETGGRSFFVATATELKPIYAEIEKELRSQYLIAYQSTNAGEDTNFRNVDLKLDQPGLEVKTIRGYYP